MTIRIHTPTRPLLYLAASAAAAFVVTHKPTRTTILDTIAEAVRFD